MLFKISFNSQLCFKSSKSIKVNLNIIMVSHVFACFPPCFPYEITMAFGWFWGFHPFSNGFGSTVLIRAAKEHVSQQLDVTAMQRPPEGISGAVPERGVPQPPETWPISGGPWQWMKSAKKKLALHIFGSFRCSFRSQLRDV